MENRFFTLQRCVQSTVVGSLARNSQVNRRNKFSVYMLILFYRRTNLKRSRVLARNVKAILQTVRQCTDI